jgi:hypothetical protein
VLVPLVPEPPPPGSVSTSYDEHSVAVSWTPAPDAKASTEDVLPSRPIGVAVPTFGYNVYEVPPPSSETSRVVPLALTRTPVAALKFADARMTWGATRCYVVRAVESFAALTVESEPSNPSCVTLKDTFPPTVPRGLTAVAGQGAISLIWDPNEEADLDGYIVLRGLPGTTPSPITPQPIHETTFRDAVPSGSHYLYAVQAVDRAGNQSAVSPTVEETAR